MATFTESTVEDATLSWLDELDYSELHGPEIAPGEPAAERASLGEAILPERLRAALGRLNPNIPAEALDEVFRKLTLAESSSLIVNNRSLHRLLVNGIEVEYQQPSPQPSPRGRGSQEEESEGQFATMPSPQPSSDADVAPSPQPSPRGRGSQAVLPDDRAEARQHLRVIDETGEDYLYPSKYFVPIQVPPEAAKVLPAGNVLRNGRPR